MKAGWLAKLSCSMRKGLHQPSDVSQSMAGVMAQWRIQCVSQYNGNTAGVMLMAIMANQ